MPVAIYAMALVEGGAAGWASAVPETKGPAVGAATWLAGLHAIPALQLHHLQPQHGQHTNVCRGQRCANLQEQ
jgi:hypothetical protein